MLLHRSALWTALLCTWVFFVTVDGTLAPSYPEPGTVWKAGKEYEITWEEDGAKPAMKSWKNFKIDFMTGDNMNQIPLTNVAKNLTGTGPTRYKWKAPNVDPPAAIYFFMFTDESGENAWTTRFAIVNEDGKQVEPEHASHPNGDKIPWGIGKLVGPANSAPSAAAVSSVRASSASSIASAGASASASASVSVSPGAIDNAMDNASDNDEASIRAAAMPSNDGEGSPSVPSLKDNAAPHQTSGADMGHGAWINAGLVFAIVALISLF